MKPLVIAIVALALTASPAMAFNCAILIQYVSTAIAKMNADDATVKRAKGLIAEAERLHYRGEPAGYGASHTEAVAKAQEAGRILGLWK